MMELGTREILLAVGLLLIVVIVLDGVRRMRQSSQGRIRMARRQRVFDDDGGEYDPYAGELPGRVRVRERDAREEPQVSSTVSVRPRTGPILEPEDEPLPDRESHDPEPYDHDLYEEEQGELALGVPQQEALNLGDEPEPSSIVPDEPAHRKASQKSPVPQRNPVPPQRNQGSQRSQAPQRRGQREAARSDGPPPEVMAMHVMAPPATPFRGDDLLNELMANDLRYGSMKIFHRHQGRDGVGPVLFSLANSVKPGTFDLNAMDAFSTPGVSLFMALDDVDDPSDAFEQMLEAAHNLAGGLGGELKDESRSALTRQTEDHCRQRIKEFERRRLYRTTDL